MKLIHSSFFEKVAIFILGNYQNNQKKKSKEYHITFLFHDYFLTHLDSKIKQEWRSLLEDDT